MASYLSTCHGLKSPTCGGFRGPTSGQPPRLPSATTPKSPVYGGGAPACGSGGLTQHSALSTRPREGRKEVKPEKQTYLSSTLFLEKFPIPIHKTTATTRPLPPP